MTDYHLVPHPDCPSVAVTAITVSIERHSDTISLRYLVAGDPDQIVWPPATTPARTDELWMTTCFEAFVQPVGRAGYIELNLSPSGRWASYAFDGHRDGMRDARCVVESVWSPPILSARADLSEIGGVDWHVGLTMVVEATDGIQELLGATACGWIGGAGLSQRGQLHRVAAGLNATDGCAARWRWMAHKKPTLPTKICAACQRPFSWRKKWERDWEAVKFCSDRLPAKRQYHCLALRGGDCRRHHDRIFDEARRRLSVLFHRPHPHLPG